ncbi:MAG: hypothetical protein ACK4RZ_11885 [Paracoccaceae bacterium]
MSEPMSNTEIEDVLSSIRRLVSEDLRPAPRGQTHPQPTKAEIPAPSDKLLLTPALRVVTTHPAESPVAPPADLDPVAAVVAPEPMAAVEDVVARLGASVPDEEWESPFGDPEVWHDPQPSDQRATFMHRSRAEHAEDAVPDFRDAPMAAFAEIDDVLPEAVAPPAADAVRQAPRMVTPPQHDSNWANDAEAAVMADLAQDAQDEVITGLYDGANSGMTYDEDVLRDLVRDLIREELTGALGERITRNVRKLVRAEIARAMTLHDFE